MARNYDDERICKKVTDRMVDDTDLDASDIEVGVDDGAVTLSGSVDSLWDKRRAEDIAKSVYGVRASTTSCAPVWRRKPRRLRSGDEEGSGE